MCSISLLLLRLELVWGLVHQLDLDQHDHGAEHVIAADDYRDRYRNQYETGAHHWVLDANETDAAQRIAVHLNNRTTTLGQLLRLTIMSHLSKCYDGDGQHERNTPSCQVKVGDLRVDGLSVSYARPLEGQVPRVRQVYEPYESSHREVVDKEEDEQTVEVFW